MSLSNIPDHPDIRRCLCSGYARPKPDMPRCPECGEEVNEFYKNRHGEIIGCEECVRLVDAWRADDDHVSV